MNNKHPKSEMPALKEGTAAAKDKQGLQKSTEKEHERAQQPSRSSSAGRRPAGPSK